MSEPKLHHYVPRFYLTYFLDASQKLWVYDKQTDRVFATGPTRIAAETQFYQLPASIVGTLDPLSIEKALSDLESRASAIIRRLVTDVSKAAPTGKIFLSEEDRVTLSEFLAAQHFRTLELRDLILYLLKDGGLIDNNADLEQQMAFQFMVLSQSGLLEEFAESIYRSIWLFAKNVSAVPLITSDHPVCIKTGNNRMWIKGVEPLRDGNYLVFPMTPHLVLYCKEAVYWAKVKGYDLSVSPVALEPDMVHHENCGQAFMASRFLISSTSDFGEVRDFIPSIGAGTYATNASSEEVHAVERVAQFLKGRNKKT